jgi:hypothetical protein
MHASDVWQESVETHGSSEIYSGSGVKLFCFRMRPSRLAKGVARFVFGVPSLGGPNLGRSSPHRGPLYPAVLDFTVTPQP